MQSPPSWPQAALLHATSHKPSPDHPGIQPGAQVPRLVPELVSIEPMVIISEISAPSQVHPDDQALQLFMHAITPLWS